MERCFVYNKIVYVLYVSVVCSELGGEFNDLNVDTLRPCAQEDAQSY